MYSKYLGCILQRCLEDTTKCIPLSWLCNGKVDCPQGSDEQNCICKQDNMMQCTMTDNRKECLPSSWICEGFVTCQENQQQNCNFTQGRGGQFMCDSKYFWCIGDNRCVAHRDVCSCDDMKERVFCQGQT